MAFRDVSPGARGMFEMAAAPVNAFMEGQQNARRNALVDTQTRRMNMEMDEDEQFDAALKSGDFDTAMRIDPEATQIFMAYKQQQAMSGLGEIPITSQKIDEKAIFDRGMKEREFAAERQDRDRTYRLNAAQEARLSRPQSDDSGKPPSGYRWKQDGSLEAIPGGPEDRLTSQPLSPKDTNTARIKLTQIKVAKQQLAQAKAKYKDLQDSFSAGPGGNLVPTPKGKAFDAAVDSMRGSITALTRVPGVGAMSDYETRLDQSKFPSRGNYEEVGAQQLQALEDLITTLESGYSELLGEKPAESAPKRRRFNPATGKIE